MDSPQRGEFTEVHRAEGEEGAVGERVGEMRERARGGKSRAVYFWWGVGLSFASSFALFVMIQIYIALETPETPDVPTPTWSLVLFWLIAGFPWLVGLGLAVARVIRGRRVHPLAYLCGALLVLSIVVAAYRVFVWPYV
jgi:hypothetical protein